ncbi:MAG: polysaccharide lyase family 7 protein [Acidiferrobacterales bacterium]|nr:polysaccharide lyase family 7 protein [Acidiferrobacterales bacterium]
MHIKYFPHIITFCFLVFSIPSNATNVVDDNFVIDGTATTDAAYFGSSTADAIEFNTNSIGLVSGSSGRQIHGLFETQTLSNPGDSLQAIFTFITPATVALTDEDIRIGLFDHLDRNTTDQLAQNTSYSSTAPNASFAGLPGFYLELDVESADPATDLDIRRSDPSSTGRLLATSSGFTAFGSGPDLGYAIQPNTQYTVVLTVTRTVAGTLDITAEFDGATHTSTDLAPASYSFGMLALGSSSGAFGSTNTVGLDPNIINDNGVDITNFSIEFTAGDPVDDTDPVDDPGTPVFAQVVNDVFATDGTDPAATDAAYFASSTSSAIEFNTDSIGLVSGSSSRQIHGLFETQTLAATGDFLEATITFTTPMTVGASTEDLRIGLFDHLERTSETELGQNTSYSSSSPNPVYEGLPGFYLELDVESADPATDLDIRRSDPSFTGRSISTSTGFSSIGNGPDVGYAFLPNTEYTVVLTVTRTALSTLDITAEFAGATYTATDLLPASFNIGMLALNASSNAFGSSNVVGDPDNGIELNSVVIESTTTEGGDDGGGDDGGGDDGDNGSDVSAVVVDDDFANNGTVGAEANYFASNSSSAIEFNTNSVGVVSGPSGRHIHSLFPTQSLERVGDILRATLSFTTPDTVSIGGDDIRFGLFDHLGRDSATELGANTTFSSASPNPLYAGLPGYYVEIDVEQFSPLTDLEIGRSTPTVTGRLLNTNGGFARENGEDIGYTIQPNTDYTIYLTVERTNDGLDVSANFLGRSFTISDSAPLSTEFGMMALNVSSDAMGISNVPGEPDNGLDITNLNIEFIRSLVVDDDLAADGTIETDMDYFASSTSSAIEFNTGSIGLVSGSSGRQIHGLFDPQALTYAGDVLQTSVTFVTPATVAMAGEDLRIGLFDTLGRTAADQLGQNTSFSSSDPNPDYAGLPGFYLELDIESTDPATDLDIRRSDPSATGRLLTTSTGFTSIGSSEDIGYVIEPNTEYTVDFTLVHTEVGELEITADFLGNSYTVVDTNPLSFNFDMLAFYANSGAVGSSNTPGSDPMIVNDNGIDITNVTINYDRFFSPEVVDLPPVELPIGDHPDIEIIPTLPEGVFVPPVVTERVIVWKKVRKVIRIFGRKFVIVFWRPFIVERPVEVEYTDAEINALHFDNDPSVQPWQNYDLTDWALDAPNPDNGPLLTAAGNVFGNGDGFSARTQDFHFLAGELFPGSEPYFFTGSDGAMVFKSTVAGSRTSQNTSYVRSELREMLRAGDETFSTQGVGPNNWALGHQPFNPDIGAQGGSLTATLSIDQVTSTGSNGQVGRVIIGQIHAEDDEPMRLYYRKLPGNTKGGIYAVHEIRGGDDINFDIIGSRDNDAADPIEDGIAPGELFSYEINNVGAIIEVVIRRGDRDGEIIGQLEIDMDNLVAGGTGYDVVDEWMYFKAGAYTQNNTGNGNDFDQVRFYRLENTH